MELQGQDDFERFLDDVKERMRVGAARHNYEAATLTRDQALSNMGAMGIGLVTGRSRALYGVRASAGMFGATSGAVGAYAGYLEWEDGIVFYPKFLNDGTVKMVARPYHDMAVDRGELFHEREAGRVIDFALTGRWNP